MAKKKKQPATSTQAAKPKIRLEGVAQPTTAPAQRRPLTFSNDMLKWMAIGFALVVVGTLLMAGGRGEDPTVYDEDVIYSFRKMILAPIVILGGLGVVIFGILKK